MKTAYFTFGQDHIHRLGEKIVDRDTVIKIVADDPRQVMFDTFGNKWSMEYDAPPSMELFPKGIIEL